MSHSISTLLTRNLHDVFGENDSARRRAAIDEIFTEDCVFYEPSGGVYRGRDEIDRVAGALRATHSDFRYQPIAAPEELGNGGRVRWVEAALVTRPLTPGPISSLPVTADCRRLSLFRQAALSLTDRARSTDRRADRLTTGMVGRYAAAVRGTPPRTAPVLEERDIRAMIAAVS
jgi:hypothetical protein